MLMKYSHKIQYCPDYPDMKKKNFNHSKSFLPVIWTKPIPNEVFWEFRKNQHLIKNKIANKISSITVVFIQRTYIFIAVWSHQTIKLGGGGGW